MNAHEVNAMLTHAALLDPRMRRVNSEERADQAIAWAGLLEDVSLADAIKAVDEHYATSTEALMPAHVVAAAGDSRDRYPIPSLDAELAADAARLALKSGGDRG